MMTDQSLSWQAENEDRGRVLAWHSSGVDLSPHVVGHVLLGLDLCRRCLGHHFRLEMVPYQAPSSFPTSSAVTPTSSRFDDVALKS